MIICIDHNSLKKFYLDLKKYEILIFNSFKNTFNFITGNISGNQFFISNGGMQVINIGAIPAGNKIFNIYYPKIIYTYK